MASRADQSANCRRPADDELLLAPK